MTNQKTLRARDAVAQSFTRLIPGIIRRAQIGVLASRNVTQTQFFVLMSVHSLGRCPMGTLASNMKVSMPTMSGVIDRLVEAGYLQRVSSPTDRRVVQVELSGKGREFIEEVRGIIAQRWRDVLLPLSQDELRQMQGLINKLLTGLKPEGLA